LQPQQQRQAVSSGLWYASVVATIALTLPLGALALIGEQISWPTQLFAEAKNASGEAGRRAADELDKLDNPNFKALAHALRSKNEAVRHIADVASFRQRAAIAPLVLALHDPHPTVRRLALWGLSEMRFAETGAVIAILLDDSEPLVRAEAARALGDLGERVWVQKLIAGLRDAHPVVRASTAHALGDLADPASIPALQAALKVELNKPPGENDAHVRDELKWALAEM
jgi:HEAT repeat protein